MAYECGDFSWELEQQSDSTFRYMRTLLNVIGARPEPVGMHEVPEAVKLHFFGESMVKSARNLTVG